MRIDIDIEGQEFNGSHGGCFTDECGTVDDYGIVFGDVSLSGIKTNDLIKMSVDAVNHLILNGVEFCFSNDDLSGERILKAV